MKEIGSEFWNVPLSRQTNSYFPDATKWYLSGRSALQAIIHECRDIKTVALPSWCCDCMIKPFIDAGIKVKFYSVYYAEKLITQIRTDCDALLIMDYFGYTDSKSDLSRYDGLIIRDVTHSIFSESYSDADYCFGSLRKWCGIWTGGYAWTDNGHMLIRAKAEDPKYTFLRKTAMNLKNRYIEDMDNHENTSGNKDYLKLFSDAENLLDEAGIVSASARDIQLAANLDVGLIINRRRKNAEILMKAFREWLIFPELKEQDCPLFVPIIVPNQKRDELRRFLIDNRIYCPVHWPQSIYHQLLEKEQELYNNELSLVCDQRYTEEDMNRMVQTIKMFWKD